MTRFPCRHLGILLSAALCAAIALPAAAYEIYKWVDEDGVVHYSQWAPEDSDAEVAKLEFERTNPPGYDPAEDDYSIENQAERIGEQWRAIAEEKEAREEAERAAAIEQRLAELERRDALHEPVYRPFVSAFPPLGHRLLKPHFAGRFQGLQKRRPRADRPPPRREGGRPGWSMREGPARPSRPGFGSPED